MGAAARSGCHAEQRTGATGSQSQQTALHHMWQWHQRAISANESTLGCLRRPMYRARTVRARRPCSRGCVGTQDATGSARTRPRAPRIRARLDFLLRRPTFMAADRWPVECSRVPCSPWMRIRLSCSSHLRQPRLWRLRVEATVRRIGMPWPWPATDRRNGKNPEGRGRGPRLGSVRGVTNGLAWGPRTRSPG
jgi:hypothetical protein